MNRLDCFFGCRLGSSTYDWFKIPVFIKVRVSVEVMVQGFRNKGLGRTGLGRTGLGRRVTVRVRATAGVRVRLRVRVGLGLQQG